MILLEGLLASILFYLIGAVPVGFIIARLVKGVDIRTVGSGNVGATNVGRLCGWPWYLLTMALDLGKGVATVWLTSHWGLPVLLAGLAVVGHDWSVFLGFNGGKGVATSLGILALLSWEALVVVLAIWALAVWRTKFVSAASMSALFLSPLFVWLFTHQFYPTLLMVCLSLLAIYCHRGNIDRLRRGVEQRAF